ncbi:MAG: carboxypeptidase regulatory-like domain-containing protein [Acidobacteria bacterium]|nr:carboxypeptidase regulatory-like domain-containing protein [Acidobacteriota bacterium]
MPVTAIPGAPGAQSAAWLQQRIPRQAPPTTAALEGILKEPGGRGLGGVTLTLRNLATGAIRKITTSAEGVFRVRDLPPGMYELKPEGTGFDTSTKVDLRLEAGEVVTLELVLQPTPLLGPPAWRVPRLAEWGPPAAGPHEVEAPAAYRQMRTRVDVEADLASLQPEELPSAREVFLETPDRWNIPMPEWDRYGKGIDAPYKKGHWWDPFNRNKFKGDVPIFGQRTFFHFTAVSETLFDARRLPVPSNVSTARPGSSEFFGKGEQALLEQTFRFTFDLFRGDAAFRPADWRIRVTPAINVNYLKTRELGIANVDVRRGTNRLDAHAGLQEAFLEVKLRDLSTNYDFLSVRAGIQGFTSDFRGFLFVEEQPGVRLFGNLHSNRWEYNLAYFHFLEKDTNSGLNTFARRHQQVLIANVYRQDFIWPGYTAQFSVHFNKDDASLHFDENGFLVRPAPIGAVRSLNQLRPHNIRAAYLGWAGNGHIGRLNLSHAFYQALGRDDFNTIAGRPVTINAQMAALELSVDKDWARLRTSFFWASGDADPRDGRARGFDAIQDFPAFAGGVFSLWNREGIRLSGSGVALTPPHTLLPSLRSSKDEGQANFVNPGLFLYNAGAAFDLTPKLRGFVHVNFLRFDRTEPLELLLFQAPIRHNIGLDYGFGVQYRPPLTENITLTGGAAALAPGRGFQDIYTGKTLFSLFANVRFLF